MIVSGYWLLLVLDVSLLAVRRQRVVVCRGHCSVVRPSQTKSDLLRPSEPSLGVRRSGQHVRLKIDLSQRVTECSVVCPVYSDAETPVSPHHHILHLTQASPNQHGSLSPPPLTIPEQG